MIFVHQLSLVCPCENVIYGNAPLLTTLLPFRGSVTATGISDSLASLDRAALGYPTFMWYLFLHATSYYSGYLPDSKGRLNLSGMAGFITFDRLTDTVSVTKLDWCSLQDRIYWASQCLFPHRVSVILQPERQIGSKKIFIFPGIKLKTRLLAHRMHECHCMAANERMMLRVF